MTNVPFRFVLFLSSFSPLLIVLALTEAYDCVPVRWSLIGVAVVSTAALYYYLHVIRSWQVHDYSIVRATMRSEAVIAYIVAYIIPFLGFDLGTWQGWTAFAILVLTVGVVYVRHNAIHVNPFMYLLNYRSFEVETNDGKTQLLLTKSGYIRPNTVVKCVKLGDYTLLEP